MKLEPKIHHYTDDHSELVEGKPIDGELRPEGIRFEGSFKQGKKHGPFVETDKEGKVVRKGVYKFGTLDVAQK